MKEKTKLKETAVSAKDADKASKENNTMVTSLEGVNITRGEVCYKSKLLNKVFDKYEDLVKAEELYEKENAEKIKQAEEKKLRAKEVEDAYKNMMQVRREANKLIAEADEKYYKLRDAFIKDYKSFHMSYSDSSGDVVIKSLFDIFNW